MNNLTLPENIAPRSQSLGSLLQCCLAHLGEGHLRFFSFPVQYVRAFDLLIKYFWFRNYEQTPSSTFLNIGYILQMLKYNQKEDKTNACFAYRTTTRFAVLHSQNSQSIFASVYKLSITVKSRKANLNNNYNKKHIV